MMVNISKISILALITVFGNCNNSEDELAVDRLETYNSMKNIVVRVFFYREYHSNTDKIINTRDLSKLLKRSQPQPDQRIDIDLKDKWSNFFAIKEEKRKIIVWSFGPDGINNYGTEDDIKLECKVIAGGKGGNYLSF